jgi:hypothetical protein
VPCQRNGALPARIAAGDLPSRDAGKARRTGVSVIRKTHRRPPPSPRGVAFLPRDDDRRTVTRCAFACRARQSVDKIMVLWPAHRASRSCATTDETGGRSAMSGLCFARNAPSRRTDAAALSFADDSQAPTSANPLRL